jgi:hypothetical protein
MKRTPWVCLVVAGCFLAAVGTPVGATVEQAKHPRECNGHRELCNRRFDQVAFAATHNSYAIASEGFAEPAQGRSIAEQLDAGIRALLIDVYQGTPTADHVCTDPTPLKVAQLTADLGKQAVDSLIAQRNSTCPPAGSAGSTLYLCHNFCEAGATRFADTLATVRTFLDDHPTEIVSLILEDYVDANAIATAFDVAGLTRSVYAHRLGTPWPTLQAMLAMKKQLVVFSEHQGGTPRWYLPAFKEIQDTPYTFPSVAAFSCVVNRGPAKAPLFLVNHWLASTDEPGSAQANAAAVNTKAVLQARVDRCRRVRGRFPNIVAVEFAELGDLLAVVDDLNGVAPAG